MAGLGNAVQSTFRNSSSALSAVFFFSGFAALVYQVVWQRLLTMIYGVGAVSTTLIVSVFMLGLGLGSFVGGRLAGRIRSPYALFAWVEALLALLGVVSLPLIPVLGRLTAGFAPPAAFGSAFAFLCLPTLLMGIGLPLLTVIFTRSCGEFLPSVSRLYFVNTLGAACGAISTGYFLVPLLGLDGAICLAAATDFVLAAAILMARRAAGNLVCAEIVRDGRLPGLGRQAYLLVFVTGFIAIGCEIIWYRVIGILVKDSPYAFASILGVYLLGIALGSRAIHRYLGRAPEASRRDLFFMIQFLIGLSILVIFAGYYYLSHFTPFGALTRLSFAAELHPSPALLLRKPGLFSLENAFLFFDVFLWPLAFLFVPTFLMGASFPLVCSLALTRRGGEGEAVGTTCFFGVMGNVGGGLLTGLVLLPMMGTENVVLMFGSVSLLFGLAPCLGKTERRVRLVRVAGTAFLLVLAVLVFPRRGELYTAMHEDPWGGSEVRLQEGIDAVVITYRQGEQYRNFINGQGHGYRPGPLFYAEAVEGLTWAPTPRSVLIIGLGAGSITETALIPAEVKKVTVVELCGSLVRNLRKFQLFAGMLGDSRVGIVVDDGRRFLLRTAEQFDVILMDPLRTTSAYSNNLHSREFFALAAAHLAQGGVLMVGGIGESREVTRTLLEVFPHVRAYPGFSLASTAPMRRDRDRLERLFDSFPVEIQAAVWDRIENALEGPALAKAVAGARVNTDLHPGSEYYLHLGH